MNETTRKLVTAFVRSAITDTIERDAALAAIARPKEERPDKWLKTREAVALAGVSWKTLRKAEKAGRLHPRHLSRRLVRWSRRELETWLCGTVEA